ncbi:hypothetical protein E2C01_066604 [Portunus trituberculatus]|uniref:Uncharacterized protein n=1 Tax=Portunus trituberculatus TaxID=210409 RepID=A0A5B7HRF1_PORTR|nr:hypothetical protein [Portunus trituberculatus]
MQGWLGVRPVWLLLGKAMLADSQKPRPGAPELEAIQRVGGKESVGAVDCQPRHHRLNKSPSHTAGVAFEFIEVPDASLICALPSNLEALDMSHLNAWQGNFFSLWPFPSSVPPSPLPPPHTAHSSMEPPRQLRPATRKVLRCCSAALGTLSNSVVNY